MPKILITGGAGFIGYHLALKLAGDPEAEIFIADNFSRGRRDEEFSGLLKKPNVRLFQVDLTDPQDFNKMRGYYDELYHLAAVVGVKHCMNAPARVLDMNLRSTLNIIEMVKREKCGKLVFSSTCETYASGFDLGIVKVPTDESVPLAVSDIKSPRFSYAVSKMAGEQLVIFNAPGNYNYAIVRYHNVFGPRMGYAHVIPEILKRIYQRETPLKVYGHDQTRSFCYIADAVRQTIACMRSEPTDGEIVHVGNNLEEITIKDLVKEIFIALDYRGKTEDVPAPAGSVKRRCPDISKIKRLTGVSPEVSLKEAIKKTVEWYWPRINKGDIWE